MEKKNVNWLQARERERERLFIEDMKGKNQLLVERLRYKEKGKESAIYTWGKSDLTT